MPAIGYFNTRAANTIAKNGIMAKIYDFLSKIPENKRSALIKILKNDPRPSYKADEAMRYGLSFAGFNIVFDADGKKIKVKSVEKI